jgi:hypothetical protein
LEKIVVNKTDLTNKQKLKEKLKGFLPEFKNISKYYNEDEIFSLILSVIRINEFSTVDIENVKSRTLYHLNVEQIIKWIETKLVPNTIQTYIEDSEFLKVLVFSLAMPYKMFKGETKATASEKSRRTKKRDFEQIYSDTFIGKVGEIAFKKYTKEHFKKDLSIDLKISRDIQAFKSDIVEFKKDVNIKSTSTLEGIWAEGPKNVDYGVLIKVALPQDYFMKILAHISSLKKLLTFIQEKIQKDENSSNTLDLVSYIEKTAYSEEMIIKSFICGFFKASKNTLKKEGDKISHLGGEFEIYENKHIVRCNELKFSKQDWNTFFEDVT